MPEDYALSLEEIKRMMANAGGTNLAGQSMAGPVATGQSYAQSIAGGMPMSQVIAPGVSYSPSQPGGYTQKDLDMIAAGPAPVMPKPPTTGEVATIEDQMPYAPPGVQEPTPYVPGQTPFPGIPDFLKDLDFSNLPDSRGRPGIDYFPEPRDPFFVKDFFEDPTASKDTAGLLDPQPGSSAPAGFIPPPPGSMNTMAFVDYYNPTTGETWSAPNGGWTAPEGWVVGRPDGGLKIFDESTSNSSESSPQQDFFKADQNLFNFEEQEPTPIGDIRDTYTPEQVAELERKEIERRAREEANIINKYGSRENLQNQINESLFKDFVTPQTPVIPEPVMQPPARQEVPFVPEIPTIPMNFTGLPQMPAIPNIPVMPELPYFPQPIQPMNFTRLSNLPVSNFVQPSVEDIVSPISRGRTLPPTPRGLFSL